MRVSRFFPLACAPFALASIAQPVPLASGQQTPLGGTTIGASPWLATSTFVVLFSYPVVVRDAQQNVIYAATLEQRLINSATLQRFIIECRVRFTESNGRAIRSIEFSGYENFATNVDYRADLAGNVSPSLASRSADGDTVLFDFASSGIPGGAESFRFFVMTNATSTADTGRAIVTLTTGESVTLHGVRIPVYTPDCPGDINQDSVVNFTDLNSVLSNFGQACP